MAYDQLFKELLRTFFAAFVERFFPDQAVHLDLSQITFLEQETATDVGQGRRRELDLVAQISTRGGAPGLILVHVELQARPEPDFPERMFEYYTLLRRRHGLRVLPFVVYVTGGRGRDKWEHYREDVFGEWFVRFRYRRLRLRSLKAMEAVESEDPLVCALAPLMDRRGADAALLKVSALQRIGQSRLDEARQWLLVNIVETYLPMSPAAERRYRELLAQEEFEVAKQVEMTWGDRLLEEARQEALQRGLEEGQQRGHAQGRQEGRQEGLILGRRQAILALLRARFAAVPAELVRQIETVDREDLLDALVAQAARATDLHEVEVALRSLN